MGEALSEPLRPKGVGEKYFPRVGKSSERSEERLETVGV